VRVRKWAEFSSDLPEDVVENEEGTGFIQYGGKSVAEALAAALVRIGCEVDQPRNAEEHGWDMHFRHQKRRLWCQVTLIEKYLLVVEDISWIRAVIGGYHPALVDLLRRLGEELARDPHFHDVRWFRSDEVHSGIAGSKAPVTE
jgi:hypothetical protein